MRGDKIVSCKWHAYEIHYETRMWSNTSFDKKFKKVWSYTPLQREERLCDGDEEEKYKAQVELQQ